MSILTGGGSQLTGLPELAARILNRPVRIGRPLGMAGLPETGQGPGLRRGQPACWSIRRRRIWSISSRGERGT